MRGPVNGLLRAREAVTAATPWLGIQRSELRRWEILATLHPRFHGRGSVRQLRADGQRRQQSNCSQDLSCQCSPQHPFARNETKSKCSP